jgi:hypothetical protein
MKSYATIKVGDRVAFSREHLRSTRQFTGWAPFARGTVIQIDDFGRGALGPDLSVATVVWGDHEPTRVNVKDLVREDHIRLEPGLTSVAAPVLAGADGSSRGEKGRS